MTSISTHNYVRSDLDPQTTPDGATARPSRGWAVAGIVAGLTSLAGGVAAGMVGAVYDDKISGDAPAILASLGDKVPEMTVFHVASSIGALALGVFGLGLYRRLRAGLAQDSLLPALAAFGLLGTAVVIVLGGSLDTEFIDAVMHPEAVLPQSAAMYNHWIGTVPAVWMLAGLSGLAMFSASRQGAVPRWLGLVGLVLGGLTVLTGISPLQYLAGATGLLWLLITAIGFIAGDRAHRAGR